MVVSRTKNHVQINKHKLICVLLQMSEENPLDFTSWLLTFHCIVLYFVVVCVRVCFVFNCAQSRSRFIEGRSIAELPPQQKPCREKENRKEMPFGADLTANVCMCVCLYRPRFLCFRCCSVKMNASERTNEREHGRSANVFEQNNGPFCNQTQFADAFLCAALLLGLWTAKRIIFSSFVRAVTHLCRV